MFLYFAAVTSAVEVENYKYRVILEPFMICAAVGGCLGNVGTRNSSRPSGRRSELDDTVPYGMPIQRLADSTEVDVAKADVAEAESTDRSSNRVVEQRGHAQLETTGKIP
jgi:hypothetical protein